MEKRKIQRTGSSSFSVSLPKEWIKDHKLKEHDSVIYFQDGDSLILLPAPIIQKQTKSKIPIADLKGEELRREIIARYVLGFDEIEILEEPITREDRLIVRKTVEMLAGFKIIEDSTSRIILRNILHPEKFSYEESISQMFLMTNSMLQDAIMSALENKIELAQDVIARDYDIDKLYFLVLRQNRSLFQNKIFDGKLRN